MYQALLAALASIPKILTAIEKLSELYREVNDEIQRRKWEKIKKEVSEVTLRIEHAKTSKERRELVRRLSDAVSK